MSPAGSTRVAAVIGSPVRHSLSPVLHNAAFRELGLDWVFVAFEVAPGRAVEAIEAARNLDLRGLSITMPHKSQAARAVDRLTPAALELGAINCVAWDGDEMVGHNTDGDGYLDAMRIDLGRDPAGLRFVVLGAGGAARAVIWALGGAGAADVAVVNRTAERAAGAAALAGPAGRVGSLDDVGSADVVVNATPVGMGPTSTAATASPVPAELLHDRLVVIDLVYQPLVTPLLQAASTAGAITMNGVGMLLHQAAHAFQLWTGVAAPVDAMRSALAVALPDPTRPDH